jgi:hypothetical protein
MDDKITAQQRVFIKAFFDPAIGQDFDRAKEIAGYPADSLRSEVITHDVQEAMKRESESQMALNLPTAVTMLNDVMKDPNRPGAANKLKSSIAILDRLGLSRQDRSATEHLTPSGLVILPGKEALEYPTTKPEQQK